jgi:hypothetical protein
MVGAVRRFEYVGPADVRPLGRGVFLVDRQISLDEAVTELVDADTWGGRDVFLRIVIEASELEGETTQT